MTELIAALRRMCSAAAGDHEIGGVAYWTDEQLQDVLDRHRTTHRRVPLVVSEEYLDGQTVSFDYLIPEGLRWVERDGTDSGWAVRDSNGGDAPAHAVNYPAGVITFEADTRSTSFYLDCRAYRMHAAAADVWEAKAGFAASGVDWRSDNHQISAGQEQEHCLAMARKHRAMDGARISVVELWRSDEA